MKATLRLCLTMMLYIMVLVARASAAAEQTPESQAVPPKFVVNVNRVLVPVVVRDKQGKTVSDLTKEDFQVFDNGKVRTVSGFTVENRGALVTNKATAAGGKQAVVPESADSEPSALPNRITVFLFDDMHLSLDQLPYVQKAGVKALEGALADSDMAGVVSTSGKTNSGLTRDRSKLQEAIMGLRPAALYRSSSADCPNIDYYQADLIENKHDPTHCRTQSCRS
jgi:VWFA-related protein